MHRLFERIFMTTAPAKTVDTTKPAAKLDKTVAKAPEKALVKAAPKPAKKAPVAPAKPAPQVAAKAVAKAAPKAAAVKAEKVKKPKLVRDSFTIPKAEYLVVDALKQRAAKLAQPVKKSELLRAGIKALAALSDTALKAALQAVPAIKTGRPKN
jgi:hypothetical protein